MIVMLRQLFRLPEEGGAKYEQPLTSNEIIDHGASGENKDPSPNKASVEITQLEERLATTKQALLKSTQQLELTQKALEQANSTADRLRDKLDALDGGKTQKQEDHLDDPYSGTCKCSVFIQS